MQTKNKPQIRAENLQRLIVTKFDGNRSKFSRVLAEKDVKMSAVQIGQWIDGVRNMSEDSAERIEIAGSYKLVSVADGDTLTQNKPTKEFIMELKDGN